MASAPRSPGNLNRVLPATMDAIVQTASWTIPNVFRVLEEAGEVPRAEMFRAFNMGVGMVVIADPAEVDGVLESSRAAEVEAWVLGHIAPGSGRVILN